MSAKLVAMTLCAACTLVDVSSAQTEPQLVKGTRVRVIFPAADSQPARSVIGSLVRLERDTVVIWTSPVFASSEMTTTTIALDRGRRLETVAPGHGHGRTGAGLGAVFGALAGAVIGSATWRPCTKGLACVFYPTRGEHAAGGALAGAAGGALVGLVIGSSIRSGTWVPVHTAGLRVAVAPGAAGINVAF